MRTIANYADDLMDVVTMKHSHDYCIEYLLPHLYLLQDCDGTDPKKKYPVGKNGASIGANYPGNYINPTLEFACVLANRWGWGFDDDVIEVCKLMDKFIFKGEWSHCFNGQHCIIPHFYRDELAMFSLEYLIVESIVRGNSSLVYNRFRNYFKYYHETFLAAKLNDLLYYLRDDCYECWSSRHHECDDWSTVDADIRVICKYLKHYKPGSWKGICNILQDEYGITVNDICDLDNIELHNVCDNIGGYISNQMMKRPTRF